MTPEQEDEVNKICNYFQSKVLEEKGVRRERARRAWDAITGMRQELESLRAFKCSVDEALNSGDGSYRP